MEFVHWSSGINVGAMILIQVIPFGINVKNGSAKHVYLIDQMHVFKNNVGLKGCNLPGAESI